MITKLTPIEVKQHLAFLMKTLSKLYPAPVWQVIKNDFVLNGKYIYDAFFSIENQAMFFSREAAAYQSSASKFKSMLEKNKIGYHVLKTDYDVPLIYNSKVIEGEIIRIDLKDTYPFCRYLDFEIYDKISYFDHVKFTKPFLNDRMYFDLSQDTLNIPKPTLGLIKTNQLSLAKKYIKDYRSLFNNIYINKNPILYEVMVLRSLEYNTNIYLRDNSVNIVDKNIEVIRAIVDRIKELETV